MTRARLRVPSKRSPRHRPEQLELAVVPGLDDISIAEVHDVLGGDVPVTRNRPGSFSVPDRPGYVDRLTDVRTVGAVYVRRAFAAPRPRSLLGDGNIGPAIDLIRRVTASKGAGKFNSLRISAAGADSPVLTRLASELARAVDLPVDQADGDLVVRVYPQASDTWNIAVRTTPRPLSTRLWRVPGFSGALEATVAAAMVRLTRPAPDDVFADVCCGSGTIVIERQLAAPARSATAVDIDPTALAATHANAVEASVATSVSLVRADAARLPLLTATMTAVCSNPPWGHQMGSHTANRDLYPDLLAEAARATASGGRLVLLTHEVRLMQRILLDHPAWALHESRTITLRGHHPRIWTLYRR